MALPIIKPRQYSVPMSPVNYTTPPPGEYVYPFSYNVQSVQVYSDEVVFLLGYKKNSSTIVSNTEVPLIYSTSTGLQCYAVFPTTEEYGISTEGYSRESNTVVIGDSSTYQGLYSTREIINPKTHPLNNSDFAGEGPTLYINNLFVSFIFDGGISKLMTVGGDNQTISVAPSELIRTSWFYLFKFGRGFVAPMELNNTFNLIYFPNVYDLSDYVIMKNYNNPILNNEISQLTDGSLCTAYTGEDGGTYFDFFIYSNDKINVITLKVNNGLIWENTPWKVQSNCFYISDFTDNEGNYEVFDVFQNQPVAAINMNDYNNIVNGVGSYGNTVVFYNYDYSDLLTFSVFNWPPLGHYFPFQFDTKRSYAHNFSRGVPVQGGLHGIIPNSNQIIKV